MKIKSTLALLAVAAMLIFTRQALAVEPAAAESQPTADTAKAEFIMKIADVAGSEHPINLALQQFKKRVEERTCGRVAVKIYDNAELGGELDMMELMNLGSLSSTIIMSGSLWERYDTAANITLIPFLFDSLEGARKAWHGEFGKRFAKKIIEPNGAYVLSYWESGFRHFTNNQWAIRVPEDMQGIKFRATENDMKVQMFRCLNADVTMLPYTELYQALQQGIVDGQENPAANILASSLYEVQLFMSLTGHMYDPCVFCVNRQWFDALPKEDQNILIEEADKARTLDLELSNEKVFIDKLRSLGLIINEVDREAFLKPVKVIWDSFEKEHPGWIELARKSQK